MIIFSVHAFDFDANDICGDCSGGIAYKEDYIGGVDGVPPRTALDFSCNGHGKNGSDTD